jgi:hypothetical protein
MKELTIGQRVRVASNVPSFSDNVGRVVKIIEPFVAAQMKDQALEELPLYSVRLEDGRSVRFRGRDLTNVQEG